MRLSITSRLTITSGVLTALVFIPAGVVLYVSVAAGIRAESARNAKSAATDLAFMIRYQWDADLMVQYRDGAAPLQTISLDAPHWAVIRGDGTLVHSRGIFELPQVRGSPDDSFLVDVDGETYRVASVALLATQETFENLPEHLRASVRKESPSGVFLRAKWESARLKSDRRKGVPIAEVAMLEPGYILELTLTQDGKVHRREKEKFDRWVPRDLIEGIGVANVEDVSFAAWKAYNGQLIAVVRGSTAEGDFEFAVNRVGEHFILDEDGNVLGPDPDSRLWMLAASVAAPEVAATTRLRLTIAVGLPLVWGAVVFIGWYVTRRALSPVKSIVETVERIQLSRLDERLPVGEVQDELSRISATVNRMLDRIKDGYRRERQFTVAFGACRSRRTTQS